MGRAGLVRACMVRAGLGLARGAMAVLLSFACLAADRKGGVLGRFESRLLRRSVPLALHVPEPAALSAWRARHGDGPLGLVLCLPGAFDGPEDFLERGVFEDLARREAEGSLRPSLWVAVAHFRAWYADRLDGRFPYERFLVEELIPALEREHPGFGGARARRSVAGLSMGGFGSLNLAGRTSLFSRCAAFSPALVEPPFARTGFLLRRSLRRAVGDDPAAFAPWNPQVHLGGETELYLGCGRQDKYGLAGPTGAFAERARKPGRTVHLSLREGGHDWRYWTPEFSRLAAWLAGGGVPGP